MAADYSLYLVTDSSLEILGGRDIVDIVDEAIRGGVTVVQYRDKTSDTAQMIDTASRLHRITQRHRVPLLINDRVDVALAVGAEGVHLGQEDMSLDSAREVLGNKAIIGITVCSVEEAAHAARGGADYLGIGTIFTTPTKPKTKSIIGTTGLRRILGSLSALGHPTSDIPTVCIGGINARNVQRVLHQAQPTPSIHHQRPLDGVAVVSAIMGAPDPRETASHLRRLLSTPPAFAQLFLRQSQPSSAIDDLLSCVGPRWQQLAQIKPLCHNMTNTVVQNFAANVALALGASPIMSLNSAEASDLAAVSTSALVLNMGTLTHDALHHYKTALAAYNVVGRPTLFDPVGGGATAIRRQAVRDVLDVGHFDVIKGNEAEIRTVWRQGAGNHVATAESEEDIKQHGVDSGCKMLDEHSAARLVRDLARRERTVVLMTGETDFISDGSRSYVVRHGHEYLGSITGSGCALGTTIASFLATDGIEPKGCQSKPTGDRLLATLAGLIVYELAAEDAAKKATGPGSFTPCFLDSIYALRQDVEKGNVSAVQASKVSWIAVDSA